MAFVATDPDQVVVSFDGGETLLYDLNTEQSITALETQTKDGAPSPFKSAIFHFTKCPERSQAFIFLSSTAGSELINRVVSHPTEPVSITAHENRTIRYLDNKTGTFPQLQAQNQIALVLKTPERL